MHTKVSHWVPVLTSEMGLSLTSLNWQEVQTTHAVYYLDVLLLKPGHACLMQLTDCSSYLNAFGEIILNATRMLANKEGLITITSPFDGHKVRIHYDEVVRLINQLRPHRVVFSSDILRHCPALETELHADIIPYISCNSQHVADTLPTCYGIAFAFHQYNAETRLLLEQYNDRSRYVYGDLSKECVALLAQDGVDYIESDQPVRLGGEGLVYSGDEVIDLKKSDYALDVTLLDSSCTCPTCASQFTKAYLHHLIHHTPLLCQRFLIQHNAFQIHTHLP